MSEQNVQSEDQKLEYDEISIGINDLDSTVSYDAVYEALKELRGIRAMRALQGGVMISFNPLGVTQQEICTEIERAGFTIDNIESSHKSPQNPNP